MAFDRGALSRVAWLMLISACGPSVKPPSPPPEPEPVTKQEPEGPIDPSVRRVVLGEMCPQGAGGRPAVAPLLLRGVSWIDVPGEVAATVERGVVPRFMVFGVDGEPAGSFDTLGVVEIGMGQQVATGTYVGASPCTYPDPDGDKLAARVEDATCQQVMRGCGIAAGELGIPNEPPDTSPFQTGGACMSGNELAVDIDGDGVIERFPITGVLDNVRAPAAEWTASPTSTSTGSCTPTFHIYNLKLAPPPRPGKPPDKGLVVVDVLGVVDLDGDARREIILAMRFPTVRTIVVYTAPESVLRLEKAGEAVSFVR